MKGAILMVMTHYMELLSLHSPWFLILFMAVPVVFIETIFMAEAFSLLGSGKEREKWQTLSHRAVSSLASISSWPPST